MMKRCVIFSPHQDDVVFGCGGIIQQKMRLGYEVFIVDITDGRNCFYNLFGIRENPTPEKTAEIRKNEEIEAANCIGIPAKNIFFLEIEECLLIKYTKNAVDKLLNTIKEIKPSEVFVPTMEDRHFDHIITNLLVKKVIRDLKLTLTLYEYFVWGRLKIEKIKNKNLVKIDISKEIEKKKEAAKCYRSQISLFVENQEKPILDPLLIELFFQKNELFSVYQKYAGISNTKYHIKLLKIKIVYLMKKAFCKHPIFFQN